MKDLIVLDLLRLVKDKAAQVEIDDTESDFQCVLNLKEARKYYAGYKVKELQNPVDSLSVLKIII